MTGAISLSGVSKSYKRGREEISILRDLNLSIEIGEFVAVMGPSGSGKTTLLNLISGIDDATSGQVTVAGCSLHSLDSSSMAAWRARHVGFIFQFYNLLPALTAEHNVEVPLLLTTLSKTERQKRVEIALDLVGLSNRRKHKPDELSGGQQQRVAIARAIVADPSILICDEPTGDLDRESANDVLSLLSILNKDHGKTVVMVTHDPKAAEYASRKLLLDKGAVVSGTVTAN